jgi:hypothetical protein
MMKRGCIFTHLAYKCAKRMRLQSVKEAWKTFQLLKTWAVVLCERKKKCYFRMVT